MSQRILVKAAMRSADVGRLAEEIQRLEVGGIDALHFDVMDGRFVSEICMGPSFIRGLRPYTTLPFEVHLLVQEPDGCVEQYVDAGAECVLIHVEAAREPAAVLQRLRGLGRQVGLAIAPATPSAAVAPYLELCHVVNVMLVMPGKPGILQESGVQNLMELARQGRCGGGPLLQADGAVSPATRDHLIGAGAQAVVAGFPIFSCEDFGSAIAALQHGRQPMPMSSVEGRGSPR